MPDNISAFSIQAVPTNTIHPNIAVGPQRPLDAHADLIPILTKTIAVLTAGVTALRNRDPFEQQDKEAARQLIVSTCFLAAGEARAVLALVTIALPMQARIHVRSIDEMLRRIAVYFKDNQFALHIFTSANAFRADGLRRLTSADRDDLEERNAEVADQIAQLAQSDLKPPHITNNAAYDRQPAGLTSFDRWAYSQVEHGTLLALSELANQMAQTANIDLIYGTADAALLLAVTVGMLQSITLFLIASRVDLGNEFDDLVSRMNSVIAAGSSEEPQ